MTIEESKTNGHDETIDTAAAARAELAFAAQAAKLKGRLAERIIELFKTVPTEWLKMNEGQQKKVISRTLEVAHDLVVAAAHTMAARGFQPIRVGLQSYKIETSKDGLKITVGIAAPYSEEGEHSLQGRVGKEALFIAVDEGDWLGADPIKPDVVGNLAMPCHEPGQLVCMICGFGVKKDAAGEPIKHDAVGEVIEPPPPPNPYGEGDPAEISGT